MKPRYTFLTSKELKPSGWLKRQLEIQAAGLAGNLDRVWPDVRDSMWIGGGCEGWERVPYWLGGFIPLAFLLEDADMIARAKRYVDAILAGQKDDGWICPNGETPREKYDTWAIELLSKVLFEWYDCSGDERIPGAVKKMLFNWYEGLKSGRFVLFAWAKSRWFETFIALGRLADIFGREEWLLDLARILKEQGTDWAAESEKWDVWYNEWTYETHIVNIGMAMKAEAVSCGLLGDGYRDDAGRMYRILRKYHGAAAEAFNGDECLAGRSPIRGFELCSVAELMYSYEWLFAVTGRPEWAERLERVAFNALPATISDDMWTHQYDQQSNQTACVPNRGRPLFGTNGRDATLFGLEPNYGCCTANFGQAWPFFALGSVMRSPRGLRVAVPVPVKVSADFGGVPVTLEIRTEYPFRNSFEYVVNCGAECGFGLEITLPSFAKNAMIDGVPAAPGVRSFSSFAAGETVIRVSFDTEPVFEPTTKGLRKVRAGSLYFSLPVKVRSKMIEYERRGVERKFPYCDWELFPDSAWNYGFFGRDQKLERTERGAGDVPFSSTEPPVTVRAKVARIDWGLEPGYRYVCAAYPRGKKAEGDPEYVDLVPYGCAKLRMTEMPFCEKS